MPQINEILSWIENHSVAVDLLKWSLVLLLAWVSGAFKLLRLLTKRPKLKVSEIVSACAILREPHDERENAEKAIFLLNLEVVNPSRTLVVINSLEMKFASTRPFWKRTNWISAVSLPSRVRIEMGAGTKVMRNWFAHFPDEIAELTVDGRIEPNDAQSGYALFVTHTFGSWNPKVLDGAVRVTCRALSATGDKVNASGQIPVMTDPDRLEVMVPGVLDQARHPSSWNIPARF